MELAFFLCVCIFRQWPHDFMWQRGLENNKNIFMSDSFV